jgi:cytochrome b561
MFHGHLSAARRAARSMNPFWRTSQARRHSPLTLLLHWSTAALLVLAVAAIVLRDYAEGRALNVLLLIVHESCGIAVLALTIARIAWRIRARVGAVHAADQPRALHRFARTGHYALYGMLLALPVLGWLTVDAHGRELLFLGVFRLPHLIAQNHDLADGVEQWHLWTAWVLLALVAGYVLIASLHHHVRGDSVLSSMLPSMKRPQRPIALRLESILIHRRRIAAAMARLEAEGSHVHFRSKATGN